MKKILQKIIANKYIINKYTLTVAFVLVWLTFFDRYDWISQYKVKKQINIYEQEKNLYQKEIENNTKLIQELYSNNKALEKFARENYLMKKDNEDIFIMIPSKNSKP